MNLSYREAEVRDLGVCRGLLSDQGTYSEDALAVLPDIWQQWLADGVLNAAVMELQEGSSGPEIIQFGMSVFVTDEFMASARAALEPHVGKHLVSLVLAGRSPCLDWASIRRSNSGEGLNLLVLHFGFVRRPWTAEQFLLIVSRMPDSFYWLHSGYNLKESLIEFSEDALVQFSLASGFVLRSDFSEFYRRQPLPPDGQRPRLMGLTREEAAAAPGVNIARLFPYNAPRFFFNRGEQQVLLRALQGRSDEETAALLDVTLSTAKKRWASIYDRVSDCAPEMLPDASPDLGSPQRMRGQEKRRYLLAYLRQHPEELRPSLPRMKSGGGDRSHSLVRTNETARKQTETADRP